MKKNLGLILVIGAVALIVYLIFFRPTAATAAAIGAPTGGANANGTPQNNAIAAALAQSEGGTIIS